jgi:hypothetical protein
VVAGEFVRGLGIHRCGKEGKPIHPDKIYRALKEALRKLGLEGDVRKLRYYAELSTIATHLPADLP